MQSLPIVSSMWIGPKLSFLEQLCLKSFVDAGHVTKLYVYDDVEGIPQGVQVLPANEILPSTEFIVNSKTGSPGPHADKFRYYLLQQTDEVWADTDAYCLRPFPNSKYFFGCHFKSLVANGVLRLPQSSQTLKDLLTFTSSDYPVLPDDWVYYDKAFRNTYLNMRRSGKKMHISEMPWEIWGPHAITYFMHKNGEMQHALPNEVLYPLRGGEIYRALRMPFRAKIVIPENCLSIHFYGSKIRGILQAKHNGIPQPKSLLGQLCIKHGINPEDAPIS